jgi:uncharacterized protein YegL
MREIFNRLASELKNQFNPAPKAVQSDARSKVGFSEVQRRLMIYLRALWNREFVVKQADIDAAGDEVGKPFIEYNVINLPGAFFDYDQDNGGYLTGLEIYRAAATHAAAHLTFKKKPFSARSLNKLHIAMISVIEDARVETLAIRIYPGLKQLWTKQHTATSLANQTAGDYLNRLARALLDDQYQDNDPWIIQGLTLFNSIKDLEDELASRDLGIRLADSFHEKKIRFNFQTDQLRVPYRDDNRYLWRRQNSPLEIFSPFFRSKSSVGIKEDKQFHKKRPSETPEVSSNTKQVSATYLYPEWNYRSRSEDQSWVTLRESTPVTGDLNSIDNIIKDNQHRLTRMKALLRAIRDGATQRIRKLEVGDEIDINAAIRARIDISQGIPPDTRIMMRSAQKARDISVLMLLDLSRSMNNKIKGQDYTAIQLTQQVSVLFAEAIKTVGDPFAIHGFYSDSRHFVEYLRLKDFDQPFDELPKARISGLSGQRGTRMGAAIRHATFHLNQQKSSKKILLILTDGEPSDVDVPDRKYLHDDTKKSVEGTKRSGIHTFCISLDPGADMYVSRIFGATNYMVVDHVKHLPEKVLLIYAGLTR